MFIFQFLNDKIYNYVLFDIVVDFIIQKSKKTYFQKRGSFWDLLGILWKFFGNSFWNSLGIVNDCLHFERSTSSLHFQSQLIVSIVKVSYFLHSKSQLTTKKYLNIERIYLFIKILVFVAMEKEARQN